MNTALRQAWDQGRPTVNAWLALGNSFAAEIMAAQGYDSLTIDMQHGVLDATDLVPMLQAMRASGATLLARVPWLDPAAVMRVLDAGVDGVICPMINSAKEAARFVSYASYAPEGTRSFGPTRAAVVHGADYAAKANRSRLAFAMIETAEGFANLDAIVATPGLTGIYVGPADLALSLSEGRLPGGADREEPEMIAALQTIAAACQRAGIIPALHCGTAAYAARAVGWGYRMTTVGGDTRFLAEAAAKAVSDFRALTASTPRAGGA
ncbi:MAG: 2,4-dihydroxyhept-2-ene-1,7-dioic acid aldolase [Rhodobacterales bacterium 32-66-7]|nr:MAG: 2,4-dihydroxyhept-2-ene-1,7-dioic acid aldolase [Rhodobacterales bacterium 12-65-15]OYX24187.1 MAG: 2,4-dihydroxyhept-2-ene-1,7-dioic acid aldolase [Rhodobacterales bacterium 32-66-7]